MVALLQLLNENLYMVSQGVNSPNKKWFEPFVACPHMMTSLNEIMKSSPNLYVPPNPINIATMIRQYTKFPLSASSPR